MPWSAQSFKQKHNHGLTPAEAKKAAETANSILERTGDEALAIRTANHNAKHSRPQQVFSKQMKRRTGRGR